MRYKCAVVFLITSLFIAGCVQGGADPGAGDKEYLVRNVVDGDTIELANGRKVRYIGIDTPETMKREGGTWIFEPEAFATAAKDYNRSLVFGKKVTLEFDMTKKDKYGRWLAYVHIDDKMANAELLKEGYATVYTFPPNVKYVDLFLEAQKEARRNKKGFWAALEAISPDAAGDHVGEYCIIKGPVTGIRVSPHMILLNFGPDRGKYLTAVIFSRNIPLFTEKGIDPSSHYGGKYVEVVGKIEYKNGPRMIIDNPSQIKVTHDGM